MKTTITTTTKLTGTKLIFSPLTAKYLLRRGYVIIDITVNKENGKDIYVFRTDNNFGDVLKSYSTTHIAESTNYNDTYLVFDREVAKELLSSGKIIVDLKANKHSNEKEVYVFLKD